ncbi:MAG: Holliday junction branch migration protein RuvA [Thermodesulfobacterium geofontis]|uniref:Holliday junction branch migration complex subunit RuvA n=1 Tax=Thermodesulfobacterium geofontis TaxID=1295609 RepID=A0A2N7PNQ9_9BACT|nr:MAG: Holliday junction branch migration protein RuvA [Thermodesulfobacterium geofontis]PMP96797.1 MAG: Holliday junction branch migration protein RuvA [Thermodesulfobacterium geofontis]
MLYQLKGIVKEINPPNKLILQSNDFLFWEIFIPLNLVSMVNKNFLGKEALFYVVPILRKNEYIEIYGFIAKEERELFLKLTTLSKIGPKLALNLLSVFFPENLREIILNKKIKELSKVPGIGPKRAEKLYLELKNLFLKPSQKGIIIPPEKEVILEEAKNCLMSLGFQSKEVEKVLYEVFEERDTLDTLIKKALKKFSPKLKEETFAEEE